MFKMPAEIADGYMRVAEEQLSSGSTKLALKNMMRALRLRHSVEQYDPCEGEQYVAVGHPEWEYVRKNHLIFTDVMRRAFILASQFGYHRLAHTLYNRALCWADDPNCSSVKLYDEIALDWKKVQHRRWLRHPLMGLKALLQLIGRYEVQKMQGV